MHSPSPSSSLTSSTFIATSLSAPFCPILVSFGAAAAGAGGSLPLFEVTDVDRFPLAFELELLAADVGRGTEQLVLVFAGRINWR